MRTGNRICGESISNVRIRNIERKIEGEMETDVLEIDRLTDKEREI